MSERTVQRTDSGVIEESLIDPAVFAVLFDRYYERIWRYACRRAGPAIADELASETFVRAFAARAGTTEVGWMRARGCMGSLRIC